MAFANLFTKLSAVEAEVKSPVQPAFTHRNDTEKGKRGKARKRRTQGEHTDPHKKKQCYQAQTTRTYNVTSDDSKAAHYYMHNTDSKHASFGFTKEVIHRHSDKAGHNNMCPKGKNYQTENNHNVNKQQEQKKKTEWQKNQHQQKNKGRPAYKGGGPPLRKGGRDRKNRNDKQDFQVNRPRFMTQEFKDQNVLLVDGRLLCRHFLWGRCIKGDDCQLEHAQVYNDLIKELCKFYVQGLCTKGESCPYMHKSFPCKFFHRRGKCSQGADCRFSHEPLNDVTSKLLDEAIKKENELYELAKKTEQMSPGHPANTDESEIIAASRTPDILQQPLRPNFYKSTDIDAEKDALFCQTEESTDNAEEAVPPCASDAAQPHSPPSANVNQEEPVCYSVEAVLGPQLSKPFIGFFTTPGSQEYAPLSSDFTSDSANQSQAPYSVDAVLRSCKSVETSSFGHTTTLSTTQTLLYTPKTYFEEITDPLLCSETLNKKVSSQTCPTRTLASGDHKKQGGKMPESKPAEKANHEASSKPFWSSSGFTEYKGRAAIPAEPVISSVRSSESANSHRFAAKQPTEIHRGSKKTQPGLSLGTEQDYSSEATAECSSKFANGGGLAVGSEKTLKTPFHSLFERPITDIQDKDDSVTSSSCSQASLQSSCPAPQSADSRSNHLKTALEPDNASAKSFLSLFAAPLSAAPLPCTESQPDSSRAYSSSQQSLQSVDKTCHSTDSKLRASNLETPLPSQARTHASKISHVPRFPNFSPDESGKDSLPEHISPPTKQLVNPVCSIVSNHLSDLSTTPPTCGDSPQSHKGSAGAATANSVLKTLFLCLRPYQEDEEQQDRIQISVPSESERRDERSTGCVSEHQQKIKKKGRQKKKLETQDSH